ncbi:TRAP transporter small permease [Pelagibius litoralis]|uniref:TRAP transporter small permease protein n=2 Tax=Pelagibius litoralis TaxID=374515 RepID=A0A967EXA8_9PROT|nr:TRAP transporter small permease [Pelagibius litoralis]
MLSGLRRALDGLYLAGGVLAGLFLISIAVLVLLSIVSRLLGIFVPGLSEYAGYAMASSSFLALAYTFGRGGHIRVNLVLTKFSGTKRRVAELWCLAAGSFLAGYLAWFSVKMVRVSHMLGDISEGSDAIPLWIPQIGMAAGAVLLAVALIDRLISVAAGAPLIAEQTSE